MITGPAIVGLVILNQIFICNRLIRKNNSKTRQEKTCLIPESETYNYHNGR